MTTLYRPVLIESVEQAEALPVGTIAILDDDTLPVALHVTKTADHLMPWRNGKHVGADENVVGARALVPIEAEEEHKGIPLSPRPSDAPWPPHSTPNQDADGRWYYTDEDGYSTAHLAGHPFHDLMVAWIDSLPRTTHLVTPWEEA